MTSCNKLNQRKENHKARGWKIEETMSQARQFVLVRFFFNFQNPHDRLEIRERTREGVSFSPMKTILIFFFLLHTRLKFLNITININLHCVWHSDISTTGFFSFSLFICSLYVRVIYFIFKLILLSSFFCIFFFNCLLIENFTRQFFTDQRLALSFFFFFFLFLFTSFANVYTNVNRIVGNRFSYGRRD